MQVCLAPGSIPHYIQLFD